MFDIISCLSANENDALRYSAEIKPEGITEQAADIREDSAIENSISENTAGGEKDETRVSYAVYYATTQNNTKIADSISDVRFRQH